MPTGLRAIVTFGLSQGADGNYENDREALKRLHKAGLETPRLKRVRLSIGDDGYLPDAVQDRVAAEASELLSVLPEEDVARVRTEVIATGHLSFDHHAIPYLVTRPSPNVVRWRLFSTNQQALADACELLIEVMLGETGDADKMRVEAIGIAADRSLDILHYGEYLGSRRRRLRVAARAAPLPLRYYTLMLGFGTAGATEGIATATPAALSVGLLFVSVSLAQVLPVVAQFRRAPLIDWHSNIKSSSARRFAQRKRHRKQRGLATPDGSNETPIERTYEDLH